MPTIVERAGAARAANLALAFHAKTYVDSKIDIGASNQLPNAYWGWPARKLCVAESRSKIEEDLKGQTSNKGRLDADSLKKMVDTWAHWSRHYGCGNCGEQSALAFVHLRDTWKARPLDWMQVGDFEHGFVAIGRSTATVASSIRSWNPEAVICDPWRGVACAADQAAWLRGEAIGLIYRIT